VRAYKNKLFLKHGLNFFYNNAFQGLTNVIDTKQYLHENECKNLTHSGAGKLHNIPKVHYSAKLAAKIHKL
jgi:hypothetical protein